MKTINEIYELIKQKKNETLDLFATNINETRNKLFNDFTTNKDIDMNEYSNLFDNGDLLKVKIDLYTDILNLIEESGVLEELAEKDKEIGKLTRRLNLTTAYKDNQKERANKYFNELKQIRKQVCDEIRNVIDNENYELWGDNNRILSIHAKEFNAILDKIEKGE